MGGLPEDGALDRAARALAEILATGLPVEAATLARLLEATGLDSPAAALAAIAADPDTCEFAPLNALIHSPGPALRLALEPLLWPDAGEGGPEPEALAGAVLRQLAGRPAKALLPDGGLLPLRSRPEDILALALRLRPQATAPLELRTLLRRRFPPEKGMAEGAAGMAAQIAALLRHGRLVWTPARVFFLSVLLERAGARDDLPALTSWALRFLDLAGAEPDLDLRAALALRRQELVNLLRQARAQEEARERSSFELRLALGQRSGHLHAPDIQAELALLERAGALVCGAGFLLDAGPEPVRLDLGEALDADDLLRLLPRD